MDFQCPFSAAVWQIANAIAQLSDWWGESTNKVRLMQNNANIDANTVVGDLVEATFLGSDAINVADSPQVRKDPLTGKNVFRFYCPEQGYAWYTGSTLNLPQTIYGAYVTNLDGDKLLGAAKFPTPIVLTAEYQLIDLGNVIFEVSDTPIG